jgi:hypothetical protein
MSSRPGGNGACSPLIDIISEARASAKDMPHALLIKGDPREKCK